MTASAVISLIAAIVSPIVLGARGWFLSGAIIVSAALVYLFIRAPGKRQRMHDLAMIGLALAASALIFVVAAWNSLATSGTVSAQGQAAIDETYSALLSAKPVVRQSPANAFKDIQNVDSPRTNQLAGFVPFQVLQAVQTYASWLTCDQSCGTGKDAKRNITNLRATLAFALSELKPYVR